MHQSSRIETVRSNRYTRPLKISSGRTRFWWMEERRHSLGYALWLKKYPFISEGVQHSQRATTHHLRCDDALRPHESIFYKRPHGSQDQEDFEAWIACAHLRNPSFNPAFLFAAPTKTIPIFHPLTCIMPRPSIELVRKQRISSVKGRVHEWFSELP